MQFLFLPAINREFRLLSLLPMTYLPISIESTTMVTIFRKIHSNYKLPRSLATVAFSLTIRRSVAEQLPAAGPSVDIAIMRLERLAEGYDSTRAIVDTVNDTSTWTIPFSGNTLNKTVT